MMLPDTVSRVAEHTADEANQRIRRRTEENIELYSAAGDNFIDRRLAELDREWDIERLLEANAASVVLMGLLLSATVSRKRLEIERYGLELRRGDFARLGDSSNGSAKVAELIAAIQR